MTMTPHNNNYVPGPVTNVNGSPVYSSPRHLAVGSGQLGAGTGPGPSLLTMASLHYANSAVIGGMNGINNGCHMLLGGSGSSSFKRDLLGGDEMSEKGNTSRSGSLFNDRRGRVRVPSL